MVYFGLKNMYTIILFAHINDTNNLGFAALFLYKVVGMEIGFIFQSEHISNNEIVVVLADGKEEWKVR